MPALSISETNLLESMKSLKSSNCPGPDNVPSIVLKRCSRALAKPLHLLFNRSLSEESVPDIWKLTYMWPRYKSGKRSNVENYRGIAKLSDIPKLFEKLIYDQLYLLIHHIIVHQQHGFMHGRSTSTNIIEFISFVKNSIEKGFQVDAIFTDFSKAFDKMVHKILLFKMKRLGINQSFVNWTRSYLHNRVQFVKFGSKKSKQFIASSGIGQGTHLGPIFFLFMINDLIAFVQAKNDLLFADDNKLYARISNNRDCRHLQESCDYVNDWCKINELYLNIDKCEAMTFTRKMSGGIIYPYSINSKSLKRVSSKMDLGILHDPKQTFTTHIDQRIAKAYGMLGFIIRRSKEFNDPYVTKSLYCCFVRPILEYASEAWDPYYDVHAKRIESIQKKFLLFALRDMGWRDRFNLPKYESRLKLIRMNTLKHRRKVAMAMFIFKLITGKIDAPHILSQIRFNDYYNANSLENCDYLLVEKHRTKYGQFEPINYMCKTFNEFFNYIDLSYSVSTQRQKLCDIELNR